MAPTTLRLSRRIAGRALPLLLLAACAVERAAGYTEGRSEAGTAFERGTAELCTLGMSLSTEDRFDPETGLFYARHLGCLVSDREKGYAEGWNDFFRAAAARGEFDGVSLRHKARTEEQVLAAFAADPGAEIPRGGALRDPTGRFAIESAGASLVVRPAGRDLGSVLPAGVGANPRVLFADGGTTALLRWEHETGTRHATIDLPSGRLLQIY